MRVVEAITTAGGTRANEDRVGWCGTLAWVIDGATDLYDDAVLPADRDVLWLVDTVELLLSQAGANNYQGTGTDLLERVAADVARQQLSLGFPHDRMPPACSIALCVDQGASYEVSRVGDATVVITGQKPVMQATDYFDRREAAAVGTGETDQVQVVAAMQQRRLHTMTSGDVESVFSGHPQRQLRVHSTSGYWSDVDNMLLFTDGFARLVTDYGLYQQWNDVIADARDHGLPYLEKLIRDHEAASSATARFKRADDVAALLLTCD